MYRNVLNIFFFLKLVFCVQLHGPCPLIPSDKVRLFQYKEFSVIGKASLSSYHESLLFGDNDFGYCTFKTSSELNGDKLWVSLSFELSSPCHSLVGSYSENDKILRYKFQVNSYNNFTKEVESPLFEETISFVKHKDFVTLWTCRKRSGKSHHDQGILVLYKEVLRNYSDFESLSEGEKLNEFYSKDLLKSVQYLQPNLHCKKDKICPGPPQFLNSTEKEFRYLGFIAFIGSVFLVGGTVNYLISRTQDDQP